MKRFILLFITATSIAFVASSFINKPVEKPAEEEIESINWMTWNEVEDAMKKAPKKVFVDVYTCWCGPCKMFSKMTLSDPRVAKYLNKNYYSIKFDAQHPDEITIGGKTYKNPNYIESNTCKRNGTHELAYAVATTPNGRLAFPTTVYFDENFNKLVAVPGFQKALDLEKILTYYNGDYHLKVEWNQFQQNFDQYQENL